MKNIVEIFYVIFVCGIVCVLHGVNGADDHGVTKSGIDGGFTPDAVSYPPDSHPHESELDDTEHDGNITGDEHHGNATHRYHLATFDFGYVGAPFILALWVLLASGAKILFHLNNKLSSIFPESCLLILLGVLLGVIMYLANVEGYILSSKTFFIYLLPPIILEAGYFMPSRAFFDNIGTILLYAVIGTLFNTLLIGFSVWGFSASGGISAYPYSLGMLQCLAFGSLLAAVDPVAVLAVFEEVHVNEVLHIVVFGESLLNDGVTVVLYHMFEGFAEIGQDRLIFVDIVFAIISFLLVAGCGILIGVFYALVTAFVSKYTNHVRVIEPLLVFVMGYLSYLTAEMFHFSGILACTFFGITAKRYIEANISQKSHTTIKYFMKMLASVCETIIFMFLGISTVAESHAWDTAFVLLTLLFCLLYRTIGVVVLTALANRVRLVKLSKVDQFVMAYGGLRGAIAFSLVVVLDDKLFPQKNLFITTTVVVVYFTVFIQGTTIKPLVNLLRVKRSDKHKPSMNEQIHTRLFDHLMAGVEDVTGHHGHHELRRKFELVNDKYLKPLLIRKKENKMRGWSILNVYKKLNERDAMTASTASFTKLQTSLSMAKLNGASDQVLNFRNPRSSTQDSCGLPLSDSSSGTCLDMAALDSQDTRKWRDDGKIHHIIEDSMFKTRQRFTRNRRHMLPESQSSTPFHHNSRHHLRSMVSHHHHKHHHHGNGGHHHHHGGKDHDTNGHGEEARPKKNVSFAEITEVSNEVETGSTTAQADNLSDTNSSDGGEGGIVFTAVAPEEAGLTDDYIPEVEPTAVESTLPWKRITGREAVSSSFTHSLPEDEHPALGERPSWVNNLDYTSAGNDMQLSPSLPKEPEPPAVEIAETQQSSDDSVPIVSEAPEKEEEEEDGKINMGFMSNGGGDEVREDAKSEIAEEESTIPPPWRTTTPNHVELEEPQGLPPPWKVNHDLPQVMEPEEHVVDIYNNEGPPPPWRTCHDCHIGSLMDEPCSRSNGNDGHKLEPSRAEMKEISIHVDTESENDTIPPPWRSNTNGHTHVASRPKQVSPRAEEEGYIPPAPWRQNSDNDPIKSPSASYDLETYSVRPQMSTQSFRLSEAESKHSEPMHVHHKIDPPPRHHPECGDLDSESLANIENEEMDYHERVSKWLVDVTPEAVEEEELTVQIPPSPSAEDVDSIQFYIDTNPEEQKESIL